MTMKPKAREAWIYAWMKGRARSVDVLDRFFVDEYTEATGATTSLMMFGADKCPQLGRDLGRMHRAGLLTRYAAGLSVGDSSMGFPKWVWHYSVAQPPNTNNERASGSGRAQS